MKEISHVGSFLKSFGNLASGDNSRDIGKKLSQAMANQISKLPSLDSAAATRLADVVVASSYDAAGKLSISKAIEDKLIGAGDFGKQIVLLHACSLCTPNTLVT